MGGNAYVHDAKIVDTLPDLVEVVTVSDGGLYDPVKHTVTWLLGEVTPVTKGTYTIVTNVPSPQYNGTKLTNKVVISDKAGNTADASVISTIRSSHELKVEKLAAPEPVDAGSDLTYTINWAVTGNEPAKDAMIVDTLPAIVKFVSATGGGIYDSATHKITWQLGEVMTPKNGSFTVVVTVPSPQYNGTKLTNVVDFTDKTPGSVPAQGHCDQHHSQQPRAEGREAGGSRAGGCGQRPDLHDQLGGHRQRAGQRCDDRGHAAGDRAVRQRHAVAASTTRPPIRSPGSSARS